jgi:hypothetical protein
LTVQSVKSLGVEGKGSILDIAIPIAAPHRSVQGIQDLSRHHVKLIDGKVTSWEIQTERDPDESHIGVFKAWICAFIFLILCLLQRYVHLQQNKNKRIK